ncbi:MAG: hypothetical protein RBS85_07765 [Methanofastidiosum sp.]|nr:hypothetical protein [Methanofastidiosum sp.]
MILYSRVMALIHFLIAVSISTVFKGKIESHFKTHRTIAIISIVIGLIHGLMGILVYL